MQIVGVEGMPGNKAANGHGKMGMDC